jgi:hypothetical protein
LTKGHTEISVQISACPLVIRLPFYVQKDVVCFAKYDVMEMMT